MNKYIDIHPKVLTALANNTPIVALESTIISHGMPYPTNVRMAMSIERIVEQEGATPATIAIINGRIKVGLDPGEIEFLASSKSIKKVSKRDLAYVISEKLSGATTVSSTIIIASMVGIKVFATGGIGGVHRNANITFDISRDLEELAFNNVACVCAGIKSILDLEKTLEYLETKGVEVIGYKTDLLPAFYSRESKFKVDYRIDTPEEIASLIKTKHELNLTGGIVIANPINEIDSLDYDKMEELIEQSIKKADSLNIKGKEITPFLLNEIRVLTKDKSLSTNVELVFSNARLAAKIAKSL